MHDWNLDHENLSMKICFFFGAEFGKTVKYLILESFRLYGIVPPQAQPALCISALSIALVSRLTQRLAIDIEHKIHLRVSLSSYIKSDSEQKVELWPGVMICKPTSMAHRDRGCQCGMTTLFRWAATLKTVLLFIYSSRRYDKSL